MVLVPLLPKRSWLSLDARTNSLLELLRMVTTHVGDWKYGIK
jgi:hypothetical protein